MSSRGRAGGDDASPPAARSAGPWRNGRRYRSAPASRASSISLVNRPLPPASASGRSVMRSPLVRMATMAIAPRAASRGRRRGGAASRGPGPAPAGCRGCRCGFRRIDDKEGPGVRGSVSTRDRNDSAAGTPICYGGVRLISCWRRLCESPRHRDELRRDRRGGGGPRFRTAAAEIAVRRRSCRRSTPMPRSAGWCRRSRRGPMSRRSTR